MNGQFNYNATKEAQWFFKMYRKGHSLSQLSADIDVPKDVIGLWRKSEHEDSTFHEALTVMLPYRKLVLERFNSMVGGAYET